MFSGKCQCGKIRYKFASEAVRSALCHCSDCRASSGAPMTAWALVPSEEITIEGTATSYASSENARRHFCAHCGTGLFYTNEAILPGLTNVRIATLDDPDAIVPKAQVQVAERIAWMEHLQDLPQFDRYSG